MVEERDNSVYLLGADPDALAAVARRWRKLGLASIPVLLGSAGLVVITRLFYAPVPSFLVAPLVLLILMGPPLPVVCFIAARSVRTAAIEILMGRDFLFGPGMAGQEFMEYRNIRRVRLDVSNGRIVGATIAARISTIGARLVKAPAILVRAIFEQGPDRIRWYRRGHPFTPLSREEVGELIKGSQVPPLQELLLPSVTLARWEDVSPSEKGFLRRLFGTRTSTSMKAVTSEPFTPVTRYVNLLFVEMFKNSSETRILRRSEPLPVLTAETDRVEPPPLEDVLSRLRTMCRFNSQARGNPVEGTTRIEFDGTSYGVLCRFDDASDACCQIHLERLPE